MKPKQSAHKTDRRIAQNKKALHDYHIETHYEAGLCLLGWEVKSIRASKVQLRDSYVMFKNQEAWLIGAHIMPLTSASTHVLADPTRARKLLLSRRELERLGQHTQQDGYAVICLSLYWKGPYVKADIVLAKGKKLYDKRASTKEREWNIHKRRIMKVHNQT